MNLPNLKKHQQEERISPTEALELDMIESDTERFSLEDMQQVLRFRKSLEVEHV